MEHARKPAAPAPVRQPAADASAAPPDASGSDASTAHVIPGVPPDVMALMPWMDDVEPAPAVIEVQATTAALMLVMSRGTVSHPTERWQFLNTLDRVDDPEVRARMKAMFEAQTGESLERFVTSAAWAGDRDAPQASSLISSERDLAARNLRAMSPEAREQLELRAEGWAQQVLAVTRNSDGDSDAVAADAFRALGPRSPEEIEALRAAVRANTGGASIYEELDRSLSGNTEDEAVAGLSGDPVHAAWIGLRNVDHDPARTIEILRGLTPAQRTMFQQQQAVIGIGWILSAVPEGADRDEIRHLLGGDVAAADGAHLGNLLKPPDAGQTMEVGAGIGMRPDAQSRKFAAARAPENVLRELEAKSPAELLAARAAWDRHAAASGEPPWDALISARFGEGDPTALRRLRALSRGDRAESKALAFRDGIAKRKQAQIERALALPEDERLAVFAKIQQLDQAEQFALAVYRGEDPTQVVGRDAATQLDAYYAEEATRDIVADDPMQAMGRMLDADRVRAEHAETTRDNRVAATELLQDGQVSAATAVRRADRSGDAESKLAILEGARSNAALDALRQDHETKYGTDPLARPDAALLHVQAALLKSTGDPRPLGEIAAAVAQQEMSANELRMEHLREHGVVTERHPAVQVGLQRELHDKQRSTSLEASEQLRAQVGGNLGPQDLAHTQIDHLDSMLESPRDPYGVLPRDLRPEIESERFAQANRNLTETHEHQRDEKRKLADQAAQVLTALAMVGAIVIAQPHLAFLFDAAMQGAKIALERGIAGEAHDDSGDVTAMVTSLAESAGLIGLSKLTRTAKGIDSRRDALYSQRDPLREVYGPAAVSHPDEYAETMRALQEAGVQIETRPGSLAYSPERGGPGKLIFDEEGSIGALRHEYRHFQDVRDDGYPGLGHYLADPARMWRMEYRGYMEEIRFARERRDFDSARKILAIMKKEKRVLHGLDSD